MKSAIWFFVTCTLLVVPACHAVGEAEGMGEITRSFSVEKGGKLVVDTESGDIRISPWEKTEVFVRVDGVRERDSDRVKMAQSGNTVSVQYRTRWGWIGGSRNIKFEINVPLQFDVELETAGGDIDIRGALTGAVKGKTSGGDIRMESVLGPVSVKTSGGDITAKKIGGDGMLKTSGGHIRVGRAGGDLEVGTAGGDIKVENVSKNLTAKTAGGDIVIGDVGGEAVVSTAGGDINVGKVIRKAALSSAGGDIELRGATGVVTAKTAGGDIKLEDVYGSVEAKTAGGDVFAEITPSGKGKSRLSSSGGDVKLYIPETAKATIDARIRVRLWPMETSEYEIVSDFKPEKHERVDDEIRATILLNGGGEEIALSTVNSNIEIRKLRK
jgi:DUF4097 and DUF4098 domain-containing protein YvlB